MSKELFELYIDNLNESIKLIDVIIPAIKKFEGKVYNKRFWNTVDEALLNYYGGDKNKTVYLCSNICERYIQIWFTFAHNRSVHAQSGDWEYLPAGYEQIDLINQRGEHNKYISLDNKGNIRLNASLIVEALEEQKGVIQKNIENLKAHALKVDEYKQRLGAIQKEVYELDKSIPYKIKTLFELKTYAIWR